MIPDRCPSCHKKDSWKEDINPFTTGVPIGKHIRISLLITHGIGFYKVRYECQNCGFTGKYDYRSWSNDNVEHGEGFAKLRKKRFGK